MSKDEAWAWVIFIGVGFLVAWSVGDWFVDAIVKIIRAYRGKDD